MLIFVFGLAGSGKSFIGECCARAHGYYFYEGDLSLTEEMRACISRKESFTQEMRDRFVEKLIIDVSALSEKHADIIVSQALYKERNRRMVVDSFPEAKFVQVKVDLETLTERLKKRESEVDEKYAQRLMANFEEPALEHYVLYNNADTENVLDQFRDFLSTCRPGCSKK